LEIPDGGFVIAETTTNFVDWTPRAPLEIPTLTGYPQLFVRLANHKWQCVDQLRAIEWAKSMWQIDFLRYPSSTPSASDLFGPGRYLPQVPECSNNGIYSLQRSAPKLPAPSRTTRFDRCRAP